MFDMTLDKNYGGCPQVRLFVLPEIAVTAQRTESEALRLG